MESKNGTSAPRTSDRLRSKSNYYKGFVYYQSPMRKKVKSKKRTAAAQIAKKILTPRKSFSRNVPTDVSIVNFSFLFFENNTYVPVTFNYFTQHIAVLTNYPTGILVSCGCWCYITIFWMYQIWSEHFSILGLLFFFLIFADLDLSLSRSVIFMCWTCMVNKIVDYKRKKKYIFSFPVLVYLHLQLGTPYITGIPDP